MDLWNIFLIIPIIFFLAIVGGGIHNIAVGQEGDEPGDGFGFGIMLVGGGVFVILHLVGVL